MAGNSIICQKNNVDYLSIFKALCTGIRTQDELQVALPVCGTTLAARRTLTQF